MLSYVSKIVPTTIGRVAPRAATRTAPVRMARTSLARSYAKKYSKTHEWIDVAGSVGTVGITAHAADALGEVVYVDLPKVGASFKAGSAFGAVESVKAASDIYAPMSGEVVEINSALTAKPDTINSAATGAGWMIKLKLSNPAEANSLLDEAAYEKHAAEDKH